MKSYTKNGFLYFQYCGIGGKLGIRIVSKNTPEEVVVFNKSQDRDNYRESLKQQLEYYGVPVYQVANTATYVNMTNVTNINRARNNVFLKFESKESLVLVYPNVDAAISAVSELEEAIHDDSDVPAEEIEVIKAEVEDLQTTTATLSTEITGVDNRLTTVDNRLSNEINTTASTLTNNLNSVDARLTSNLNDLSDSTQASFNEVNQDIADIQGDVNTLDAGKADKSDTYTKAEVDQKVAKVYRPKGSVQTYADLPSTGQVVGDVYNIIKADKSHDIKAGDNVVWTEEGTWDNLRGVVDLSDYLLIETAAETYAEKVTVENHISNEANPHNVTKAQVGLGNVDNTSDANKPISTATQNALDAIDGRVDAHIENTSNPHNVTKSQVGLSNVDNTSDLNKPISTATQNALDVLSSDMSNFMDSLEKTRDDVDNIRSSVDTLNASVSGLQESVSGLSLDVSTKVSLVDEAHKIYGTDNQGQQTTYDVGSFGALDDVQINGTSIVNNKVANIAVDLNYQPMSSNPQSGLAVNNALSNYLLSSTAASTYATKEEVSQIPQFDIQVVNSLPVSDISDTTVYLLRNEEQSGSNLYDEYIYVNDTWEKLGTASVDLTGYLQNIATGTSSLTVLGDASAYNFAMNIGDMSYATANSATAIGYGTSATYSGATALGRGAKALADNAVQIGHGTNSTTKSLAIGFGEDSQSNPLEYTLLDGTTGLIPDDRISSNIARTSAIPTTFTGATSSVAGSAGLVPAPTTSDVDKYLKGDGTWGTVSSGGLQNTALGMDCVTILGTPAAANLFGSINIGQGTEVGNHSVAIGSFDGGSPANVGSRTVAIGCDIGDVGDGSIVINGSGARAQNCIALSAQAKNYTFTVGTVGGDYSDYDLLDLSTGKIPNDRLSAFTGATSSVAGSAGAVPAPAATDNTKFLRGDGTWAEAGGSSVTIDTSITSSSTNANAAGSKAVWDLVAALETRVATLEAQLQGVETQLSQI